MQSLREECRATNAYIVAKRRLLHKVPEVGGALPETSAIIKEELEEMGIGYRKNKADDGIVAVIEGKHPGKVLALRADIDALPIMEQTGLPFAANNGCMHACGHDAHGAILLGTARVLQAHRDQLYGSVRLLFQTGEEQVQGAQRMIAEGAMEHPAVDALFGLHCGTLLGGALPAGSLAIAPGPVMAAMDKFVIHIKGSGGHGSAPERCVDPIWIASNIVIALQGLVSRELAPVHAGVVSVCVVKAGSAFNIIPEEAVLEGTIRTLTQEDRSMIGRRIEEVAAGVAQSLRGSAHTQILLGPPPVDNDAAMAAFAADSGAKVLGEAYIHRSIEHPSMVGEDVAHYLHLAPGAFFIFSTGREQNNTHHPHHSPYFSVDEDVLWHGCAVLAQTACDYLIGP